MKPQKAQTALPGALAIRFYGVRGSIAAPGPGTVRHGGNTPCVEVRSGAARVVLDAGTGIRTLGEDITREWAASDHRPRTLELFLTHYHWDHIQGLPFFEPLYDAAATIRLHGPAPAAGRDLVETALRCQLTPAHFPVAPDALAARVIAGGGAPWREEELEVDALPVAHPDPTLAYRVRVPGGGPSVVYVPDCELEGEVPNAPSAGWYDDLVRFSGGADLLIHDSMYTDDEYPARRGWGHSTPAQVVKLAAEAGIRRVRLFHHAPWRDDDALAHHAGTAAASPAARDSGLQVAAAVEGEELVLQRPVAEP
jgi:phosphoribosyl 1,2-cyclic phosphodiesterase